MEAEAALVVALPGEVVIDAGGRRGRVVPFLLPLRPGGRVPPAGQGQGQGQEQGSQAPAQRAQAPSQRRQHRPPDGQQPGQQD